MGLRFFTNEPLSQQFLLPSTPLSARIAARVDLEGSRGLESLPGALFFSRSDVQNFEKCHFLPGKNRRRQRTRTSNKGWEPAAGRPKSGVSQKCSRSLWGAPGAPPESPGAPGGALGAPKGPKMPRGGSWGPWGPMGPCGALGALCGPYVGPSDVSPDICCQSRHPWYGMVRY